MKHPVFIILAFSFLWSCTNSDSGPERRAECYVRYLAPEGQLQAELTLRREFEDQKGLQAVESPGGARYRGILMRILPVQGVTYRLEQPGGYASEHIFEWTEQKSQKRKFSMDLPAINAFSFGADTLSLQRPATLTWDGAPLEKGEAVVLLWERKTGHLTVPMEVVASPGQKQIDFPSSQLRKLQPGTWTLYLVRKKRVRADVEGTTVTGLMEYFTQTNTLEVIR